MKKSLLFVLCCVLLASHLFAQSEFEFIHFNQATVPEFGGNNFKTVAVGKGGHIWAGSQNHGVVKFDPTDSTWTFTVEHSDNLITDIKADHNGNIWISNSGRSGLQNGGSNIGGGIHQFPGDFADISNFYTITGPGNLTSRNARSIWIDKYNVKGTQPIVWLAQGTFVSTNTTLAGGFSVGKNEAPPYFTKGYIGLQVTPYVTTSNARTPSCLAIGGSKDEVWIFAQANFGRNQLLRYRADSGPNAFLGAYDYTNTPVLSSGFRANAIYFDDLNRGWLGLQEGGIIIKSGAVWKTMNEASVFPAGTLINTNAITSDQQGYVYIGTNNGLVIYKGGPVDAASSYKRVTIADGLPTNNINGIAIDTFAKRIILAHNAGISFMRFSKKVQATLEWDYSFPKLTIRPKGVAADGVSRLYVKVRRDSNTTNVIKKVVLSIKKAASTVNSMIGKLKPATILDKYSNEANEGTATEVSRTDSTPSGDFYFWYVAPEDFSKDSLSAEAQLSEREDSIKVKVIYKDDTEDSSYLSVKVVRPPLMLTSMIAKAAKAIDLVKLADNVSIVQSDKLIKKIKLQMSGVADIAKNVSRLIDGDKPDNDDKENSLQGLVESLRKMGFASNRADYVGHGLAGNVLRAAAALKNNKFFADGNYTYNNYGKGFVNKFISINVPHNNSPLFDMIKELGPKLTELSKKMLVKLIKENPDEMEPYPFLTFSDSTLHVASELLKKAMMDSGFKFPVTNIKNHLIVSNAEATPARLNAGGLSGIGAAIAQNMMMAMRDHSPQLKDTLTRMFDKIHTAGEKILKFFDKYAELKGISNFSSNSDLLVPLSSQTAGQPVTLPHITKFTSDSINEVVHEGILKFKNLGRKISQLLNSSISNNVFSSSIPANLTQTLPPDFLQKAVKVFYDTNKIVTDTRELVGNRHAKSLKNLQDTMVSLKFRVKDVTGLQYIFINFQDSMYTTTSKAKNQEVMLKVKHTMEFSGLQDITAVGVYETSDSIKYHADTISAYITPPDSIQGFRVTEEEVDLFDDISYYPSYEVKIKDKWETLPSTDTTIKITIEKPEILLYDKKGLTFDANNDGFSRAYFTYKEFKDTVAFDCLLSLSKSAINRTIVNGNFRDSATWSKGRPPLAGDSIIISAGHSIVLDTTIQVRSLRIDSLGTLTLNQGAKQLQLGDAEDGDFMLDNYGTLNITNGSLTIKGRLKLNKASTFNMSNGNLIIDGNTGSTINSLANGLFLFEAAPQMKSFSFTGGTLQIVDPPIGVASQAISCPYNFGLNSTLVLGNGISFTASNSPNGFGGSLFPPVLGRLVLDAGTGDNNRQLDITKPLNVKGSLVIKKGSHLNLKAPVTVTQ